MMVLHLRCRAQVGLICAVFKSLRSEFPPHPLDPQESRVWTAAFELDYFPRLALLSAPISFVVSLGYALFIVPGAVMEFFLYFAIPFHAEHRKMRPTPLDTVRACRLSCQVPINYSAGPAVTVPFA